MKNGQITRIESGRVNCYLIETEGRFILVDTGYAKHRDIIDSALADAGCDDLRLIVFTHGDFDHVGNCAHLRERFGCRIAMHHDDVGMVEHGDMFWNREMGRVARAFGKMFTFFMRISLDEKDRFSPDLIVEDGQSLADLGLDATVYHLPGHSKGSIGLLTADGDFFCGDLFTNVSGLKRSTLIANHEDYTTSLEILRGLDIQMVYPGHGLPFSKDALSHILQEDD